MALPELPKDPVAGEEITEEETVSSSQEVPNGKMVENTVFESQAPDKAEQQASDSEIPDGGSKAWMAVAGAYVFSLRDTDQPKRKSHSNRALIQFCGFGLV